MKYTDLNHQVKQLLHCILLQKLKNVAERLLSGSSQDSSDSSRGTGIALRNVSERLQRFYGGDSSVEVMSKLGEGTCVTLRLAGVAPKGTDGRIE